MFFIFHSVLWNMEAIFAKISSLSKLRKFILGIYYDNEIYD